MHSLLIVDDEIEQREGLSRLFPWEKHGFKVAASFGSAQDAFAWVKVHEVDVVLTDIRMPFMSGLELIRKVQELPERRIIFCLLSAYPDFRYAQEGMSLGVRHYLLKPSQFNEIASAFKEIREELERTKLPNLALPETDNPLIGSCLDLIRQDLGQASLAGLADQLSVHPSYLSRLFRDTLGENFSTLLLRLKMQRAAELLSAEERVTNVEIAQELGYLEVQNFCRSFKQHYGMSPQSYRRSRLPSAKDQKAKGLP